MKGSHVCKMDTTKKVVLIVLPLLVAVLSISIWFSATAVDRTDGSVLFTFILNWMLGLCALEWEIYRRPISFAQIHWLFFLVFWLLHHGASTFPIIVVGVTTQLPIHCFTQTGFYSDGASFFLWFPFFLDLHFIGCGEE